MMDEDGQVSWPGLQQVDALEGATLSVNLTEARREDGYHSWEDRKNLWKSFFLQTDKINVTLI